MIILRIKSGLGNQMFQYAFYKKLKTINNNVKLDVSLYDMISDHNGYELNRVFNVNEKFCDISEVKRFSDDSNKLTSKIRRKVIGRKKSHYLQQNFKYDEAYFKLDEVLLDGYWQSEKFFSGMEDDIREIFSFKQALSDKNRELTEDIINSNSVAIHVRRGDYLTPRYYKTFGSVCSLKYYQNAVNYIRDKVDTPFFYIFTNDPAWCKENMNLDNYVIVDWNKGKDSYLDMQLMSLCKHNIIANSSFSWWGAWLNKNTDKIVVAPSIWFGDRNIDTSDIVPKSWIRAEVV
jgi:hypothetical protein